MGQAMSFELLCAVYHRANTRGFRPRAWCSEDSRPAALTLSRGNVTWVFFGRLAAAEAMRFLRKEPMQ